MDVLHLLAIAAARAAAHSRAAAASLMFADTFSRPDAQQHLMPFFVPELTPAADA